MSAVFLGYKSSWARVISFLFQWHLGYFTKEYTPLYRGFDSFFGFLGSKEDYWDHSSFEDYWGYDLRDNMKVKWRKMDTGEDATSVNSIMVNTRTQLPIPYYYPGGVHQEFLGGDAPLKPWKP